MMSSGSDGTLITRAPSNPTSKPNKIIFAMVGLPARGKSYLSNKIVAFFTWLGVSTQIFNAGSKRRNLEGAKKSGRSEFFAASNDSAVNKRDQIALETLDDAINFLVNEDGAIAIFDATNTTKARRSLIQDHLSATGVEFNLIFIESVCNDKRVLRNNFMQKVKNSPDFQGMDPEKALEDLEKRVHAYEQVYETVEDAENVPYIKVIDLASKVICYHVWGQIPLRCVQLLMSSHVINRPVYLIRSGHCDGVEDFTTLSNMKQFGISRNTSENSWSTNAAGHLSTSSLGPYAASAHPSPETVHGTPSPPLPPLSADPFDLKMQMPAARTCTAHLSDQGQCFARRLGKYLCTQLTEINEKSKSDPVKWSSERKVLVPFTSTLPRAVETAAFLPAPPSLSQQWSALGILDTGICHGMTVQKVKQDMPEDFLLWQKDPFRYRFPGGESLLDMNKRLSEVVLEIERLRDPVVVVSHLSTIQSLVAYFMHKDPRTIPHIRVPRHSVLVLNPSIYGWTLDIVEECKLPLDDVEV